VGKSAWPTIVLMWTLGVITGAHRTANGREKDNCLLDNHGNARERTELQTFPRVSAAQKAIA
jgi:hypothetical protein